MHQTGMGKDAGARLWDEAPRLRIYLAGPLFSHAERRFNVELNTLVKNLGFDTYFPQEDAGLISDMVESGMDVHQARDSIFQHNRDSIGTSDILVFLLDGRVPDEGAAIEAGIGYALGKECIGLKTDFRSCEPGGNNLMIDGVLNYRIAGDLERLCRYLEEARRSILLQHVTAPITGPLNGRARPYVAVVGSIGAGKSTLVRLLGGRPGWQTIDEPVEENPYLKGVYQNLEGLALRVQAFYLGGRTRQHMRALEIHGPAVQDRCLYEDTEVFAATYHQMGAFDETDLATLQTLYRALAELLPRPDLLVYVHAPLEVQRARIRQRGREFEQAIGADFLARLTANYDAWIDRQGWAPVLRIDSSEADYGRDPEAQRSVLERIDHALEESASYAPGRLFARVAADVG